MGTHRLAAVARLLAHLEGLTVYAPADGNGATALELALPGARLTLVLTVEPSRGFSGEGSLLTALAAPNVAEDADLISALLAFDPRIDESRLAREASLPEPRVRAALAVLGGSGRVGWDNHEQAWFHRELPHDPWQARGHPAQPGPARHCESRRPVRRHHLPAGASGRPVRPERVPLRHLPEPPRP